MRITVEKALELLGRGHVVALPTETVYGLAASIYHPKGIEQIYTLKKRPSSNPLIIHVASTKNIQDYAKSLPLQFNELAKTFWPGPLTLILPVYTDLIPHVVRAGLPTAGFRIPNHPLTLEILKKSGPLVMPSANISGSPSSTDAEHVENDFGIDFPVVDGGACLQGLESTILYYDEDKWVIGRMGAITPEVLQKVLGYKPTLSKGHAKPICPGSHFRHYAPKAKLLLKDAGEAPVILGFSDKTYRKGARVIIMGSLEKPEEVAENLYRVLRQLDQEHISSAWVDMDFPRDGLWQTIAERLQRAAE